MLAFLQLFDLTDCRTSAFNKYLFELTANTAEDLISITIRALLQYSFHHYACALLLVLRFFFHLAPSGVPRPGVMVVWPVTHQEAGDSTMPVCT